MKINFSIRFLIVLTLISCTSIIHAQDKKTIDSLEKVLSSSKEDTSKFSTLIELASEYLNNTPNTTVKYSLEALDLARKLNFDDGIARGNGMLGVAYTNLGKFDEAKKVLNEGLTSAKKTSNKASQARIYNSLGAINYSQGDYDLSLENHRNSIKLKEELGDKKGVAYSYNNMAYNYYAKGKYPEMITIANKALQILEEYKDSTFIAEVFNTIGGGYFGLGDYPEAIKNYFLSISIREKRGDKYGAAACYLNIGSISQNIGNYSDALKYYSHAEKLYKEIGDKNNIGTIYYSMGSTLMSMHNNDSALNYFSLALDLKKETGDKSVLALTYSSIGEIYFLKEQFDKALENHFEALKLETEIGDKQSTAMTYTGIGKVYMKMKKYQDAKLYFDKSLNISHEIKDKEVLKSTYASLADLSETNGDYKNAYNYYKKYSLTKDSLLNDSSKNSIATTKEKFRLDKIGNENALLKQDNVIKANENEKQQQIRNIIVIASLILIAALIFAFYNFYNRRKITFTRTVERVNNKALRSQMNPHFMFNALQSIQSFLHANNAKDANEYLIKFSKLMRLVLENSQHQEVTIADDKEALELYMQLESIRLKHPFIYKFHVDEKIDINNTMIPPLILQPFVENAIWHGLQHKEGVGRININISQKGQGLYCSVEDDGIGRDLNRKTDNPMLLKKESLGMKLTEERLKIINELKKFKSEFKIVDLTSPDNKPNGTRVELSIPLL